MLGKIFSRVLSNFKTLFWRSIAIQSHCFQLVQTVHVWSENVGRRWLLWSNGNGRYPRKRNMNEEQKRGRVDWCTHILRKLKKKGLLMFGTSQQETKLRYTKTTPRRSNSRRWGSSQMRTHLWHSKETSSSQKMIGCFFAKFGHVATILLEDRNKVTADWYVNHCLPEVFQPWCTRRPQTGVHGLLLNHDNASAHTAAVTLDLLATNDAQLVTHPPYSPDLVSCDWLLFPSVKRQLKGKQFQKPKMPEHSWRASLWTYPSQRGRVSDTAGLRGWSNVYRLRGVSSKNWSRQSGCKCCWKTRLQNMMSDPRIKCPDVLNQCLKVLE